MKKPKQEAMRKNQRKAKIVKPLERILKVIGAIRAELSKQRRGIRAVSEAIRRVTRIRRRRAVNRGAILFIRRNKEEHASGGEASERAINRGAISCDIRGIL